MGLSDGNRRPSRQHRNHKYFPLIIIENLLWDYSSEVWYRCGDKSTDYNYYSKRILFNSAYAATELFMLTDKSP